MDTWYLRKRREYTKGKKPVRIIRTECGQTHRQPHVRCNIQSSRCETSSQGQTLQTAKNRKKKQWGSRLAASCLPWDDRLLQQHAAWLHWLHCTAHGPAGVSSCVPLEPASRTSRSQSSTSWINRWVASPGGRGDFPLGWLEDFVATFPAVGNGVGEGLIYRVTDFSSTDSLTLTHSTNTQTKTYFFKR